MERTLSGYAVLWGEVASDGCIPTHDDPFSQKTLERFERGCFAEYLAANEDIAAMVGHKFETAFGWRRDGSLRVWEDRDGLRFEMDLPDRFPYVSPEEKSEIQKGPKGVSIGFLSDKLSESWEPYLGTQVHVVRRAALREISIVVGWGRPALKTSVAMRDVPFREWQLKQQVARDEYERRSGFDVRRRQIELMKMGI